MPCSPSSPTYLADSFKANPNASASQNEAVRRAYTQKNAALVGAALGFLTSSGKGANVSNGSFIARSAVANNRNLHIREAELIERYAADFAVEQGYCESVETCGLLAVQKAETELTAETVRGISDDFGHFYENRDARNFLNGLEISGSKIDGQTMFGVLVRDSFEYQNSLMNAQYIEPLQYSYSLLGSPTMHGGQMGPFVMPVDGMERYWLYQAAMRDAAVWINPLVAGQDWESRQQDAAAVYFQSAIWTSRLTGLLDDPNFNGSYSELNAAVNLDLRNLATAGILGIYAGDSVLQDALLALNDDELRHLQNANGQALISFAMDLAGEGGMRFGAKSRIRIRTRVGPDGKTQNVMQIDVSRVRRGTAEYDAVNNPQPNMRYELSNGTVFRTNASGQVEMITYTPTLVAGTRDGRQAAVGRQGVAGDVGGHIQACRHGGSCDRYNLFPQNANFNNSAYKRFENQITRSMMNGDDVGPVIVRFERSDPYSVRPDVIDIEFTINGIPDTRRFINQEGGGQ